MTIAQRSKRRIVAGHILRWCVIVLVSLYLLRAMYGPNPWSLDSVTRQALSNIEMPEAPITMIVDSGQGIRLAVLVDRQHGMMHHFFLTRPFGILWQNRGGGYGMTIDPEVRIDFRGGMSTFGKYRHYYYMGQVHDSRVTAVKVIWHDGSVQNAELTDGVYVVARSIHKSGDDQSQTTMSTRMQAFDQDGVLLYELTPDQREVRG